MYIQDVDVSVVDVMRCMILSVHFSVILSLLMYIFFFTVLSAWHVLLFCGYCAAAVALMIMTAAIPFTGSGALQLVSELQVPTLADWGI